MWTLLLITLVVFLICKASTVSVLRVTGPSGSQTFSDITASNTTLNAADITHDGTAHPIQIPPSGGPSFSFWAVVRLCCSVAPPTKINNIYVYSDGSDGLGTGVGCNVGTVTAFNSDSTTGYTQATGTLGVTGLELTNLNYPGVGTPADFFGYTSASPLSLPGQFETGVDTTGTGPNGCFGDWLIEQVTVAISASAGVTPTEVVTFVWDEF